MHAKMPNKPAEVGQYLCSICDKTFGFKQGQLECPRCGNSIKSDLVRINVPNDPEEEKLYTKDDWHGG